MTRKWQTGFWVAMFLSLSACGDLFVSDEKLSGNIDGDSDATTEEFNLTVARGTHARIEEVIAQVTAQLRNGDILPDTQTKEFATVTVDSAVSGVASVENGRYGNPYPDVQLEFDILFHQYVWGGSGIYNIGWNDSSEESQVHYTINVSGGSGSGAIAGALAVGIKDDENQWTKLTRAAIDIGFTITSGSFAYTGQVGDFPMGDILVEEDGDQETDGDDGEFDLSTLKRACASDCTPNQCIADGTPEGLCLQRPGACRPVLCDSNMNCLNVGTCDPWTSDYANHAFVCNPETDHCVRTDNADGGNPEGNPCYQNICKENTTCIGVYLDGVLNSNLKVNCTKDNECTDLLGPRASCYSGHCALAWCSRPCSMESDDCPTAAYGADGGCGTTFTSKPFCEVSLF